MSEPPREISDDELVSSVLDDEATADERARVRSDHDLRARLETFAGVRDAVLEIDLPFDPAERRAAALASWPTEQAPTPPAAVTDLATAAARRARPPRRWLPAVAAAAVVAVAFGGWAGLRDRDRAGGGADAALESSAAGGAGVASSLAAPNAAPNAAATDAALALADLGTARDVDELARAYRTFASSSARAAAPPELAGTTGATAAEATAGAACPAAIVARAELAGRRVVLIAGTATVQVLDEATCRPVTSFPR